MSREVVVLGAGGHAKVVIATLEEQGAKVVGLFDDRPELWGQAFQGHVVKGPMEQAREEGRPAVIAIGSNRDRKRLAEDLDLEWASAAHPSAVVHPSVDLGAGTVVFAGALVQPDTAIGEHAIINTGAKIDHDCRIGAFAHVAPGAALAGNVTVGVGALVGIGSCAIPGVCIGDWAVVGAGSAVVADVAGGKHVAGTPARELGGDRA